jgi:hypothetical protein
VKSPKIQGGHNLTGNQLLLQNAKKWDKEKVELIFPLEIANCILDVPLFDLMCLRKKIAI